MRIKDWSSDVCSDDLCFSDWISCCPLLSWLAGGTSVAKLLGTSSRLFSCCFSHRSKSLPVAQTLSHQLQVIAREAALTRHDACRLRSDQALEQQLVEQHSFSMKYRCVVRRLLIALISVGVFTTTKNGIGSCGESVWKCRT